MLNASVYGVRDGCIYKRYDYAGRLNFSLRPLQLDKYFSSRKIIDQFNPLISLFLVPKKNLRRINVWHHILGRIVVSPVNFLRQYFRRNLSEWVFLLIKENLAASLSRKEITSAKCTFLKHVLQNIFTVKTNQNSFVPMALSPQPI